MLPFSSGGWIIFTPSSAALSARHFWLSHPGSFDHYPPWCAQIMGQGEFIGNFRANASFLRLATFRAYRLFFPPMNFVGTFFFAFCISKFSLSIARLHPAGLFECSRNYNYYSTKVNQCQPPIQPKVNIWGKILNILR